MSAVARILPLVTVLAWVITLAVPVLDSGNTRGPKIVVSSLGGSPFDLSDAQATYVISWIAVVGCAASAWLFRSLTWWSLVTILVALLLGARLLGLVLDPPSLIWDGADPRGRPTGGQVIGKPSAGTWIWAMGIAALLVAGVCGLAGRVRHEKSAEQSALSAHRDRRTS